METQRNYKVTQKYNKDMQNNYKNTYIMTTKTQTGNWTKMQNNYQEIYNWRRLKMATKRHKTTTK